ncbi:MAG: sigma-70 family RNA polymerase sigma factor [Candidatus Brocadiia bacterium]|nr:MAG: sigma-70 family RNA polymerase sigma factor [Candidatus Brocadiia bacterium]
MGQIQQKLLSRAKWHKSEVLELLRWNQKQLDSRSKIITSNMGLVLSMVKRVNYYGVEFTDLVSEGSMALMRATEKFDCQRGFKFSTYACQAISKSFFRAAKKSYRYRSLFPAQLESAMEKSNHLQQVRETAHQDRTEEVCTILRDNLADLSATEQSVLEMRFSLNNQEYSKPLTLKQVGYKLDLSKERIRQIQKCALAKIRQVAEKRMILS